jgi:hypothetical protein
VSRNVPDDIKDLVWTDEEAAAATKVASTGTTSRKSRARSKSRFIMFPMVWQYQLVRLKAGCCTYRVALYLLWEAWRSQSNQVKLANMGLKEWGVGRRGKRLALNQLGRAGLISTERQPRKSPVVTVKFTD